MESTNNISLAGGTRLVRDINLGSSSSIDLESAPSFNFNGQLIFAANDGATREELWISDGTAEGTQLLRDINSNNRAGSFPRNFAEFNGQLFFSANDGETGRELWVSDGTAEGTQLLRDIRPAIENGTDPFSSFPSDFAEFNGQLFFSANISRNTSRLWVSDGTSEGTQLLGENNGRSPSNLTEVNGQLFFTNETRETGGELWVSDGTAEGTQLLLDINPGSASSDLFGFTEFNGQLFFSADDGETGRELWVSDGTAEGTQLLLDINQSTFAYYDSSRPGSFTELNGQLFFTADDFDNGEALWVTDGTTEGTQLVIDVIPGNSVDTYPGAISGLTAVNDQLFFTVNEGRTANAEELWVSDGTAAGTQLLLDIDREPFFPSFDNPGISSPANLTAAGDLLFFTVPSTSKGTELWVSDGTTEGTQIFQDINLGSDSSDPSDLRVVGDQLFFTADNGTTGRELWVAKIPDNIISGDANNNSFTGTADVDLINGFAGNDLLLGRGGGDIINGGAGRDEISGNRGADILTGGAGNDQISGGFGDDTLVGGNGSDQLMGANGQDSLQGGLGQDTLRGGGQNDFLSGGSGHDLLLGSAGQDTLLGSLGNDNLGGGIGNDQLVGGTERDTLNGGTGQDTLIGGAGNDELVGGNGQDQFKFNSFNDGSDTIADFEVGIDTIDLSSIFVASRFESATPFADYIQLIQVDSDTQVQINRNGDDTGGVLTTIATLDNVVATEIDSSSFLL